MPHSTEVVDLTGLEPATAAELGPDVARFLADEVRVSVVPGGPARSGTFAVVYEGTWINGQGRVAIRVSRPVGTGVTAEALARDWNGHQLAAQQLPAHNHLVRVHSVRLFPRLGKHPERCVAVLDWAGDKTLADRVARSPGGLADHRELFRLIDPLAEAIDALQSLDLSHLDIKPANVLLGEHGSVRLGDYGSLFPLKSHGQGPAAVDQMLTREYAAPEVQAGKPVRGSDLYGLGRVYFHLRTGRRPADMDATLAKATHFPFPGLGPDESNVLRQALLADPAKRPSTATGWVEELRSAHPAGRRPDGRRWVPPRPDVDPTIPTGRSVTVGLLGPTNAGKTTLLAVLAHPLSMEGDVRVDFPDEATHVRLRRLLEEICELGGTPATVAEANDTDLEFVLVSPTEAWRVRTLDYGGSLVQLLTQAGQEFKQRSDDLLTKLCQCDAILLLVDAADPDERPLDALLRLQRLLGQRTASGVRFPCVAVVLTKADQLLGPITVAGGGPSADEVHEQALARLADNDLVRSIRNKVQRFPHNAEFVVSAFGRPLVKNQPVKTSQFRPFEVLRPLHWAARQSTAAFDTARELAAQNLAAEVGRLVGGGRSWGRFGPRGRVTTAAVNRFAQTFDPAGDGADTRGIRAQIRTAKARQRRRLMLAVAAAVTAATVGGRAAIQHMAGGKLADVQRLTAALAGDANAVRRLDVREAFLASRWSRPWLVGATAVADQQVAAAADRQLAERFEYAAMTADRQAHLAPADAAYRLRQLAAVRFPAGRYHDQYADWIAKDQIVAEDWQGLVDEREILAAPLTNGRQLHEQIDQHRRRFLRLADPNALAAKDADACRAWSTQAYQRAVELKAQRAPWAEVAFACQEALSVPGAESFPGQLSVHTLLVEADAKWDRQHYAAVVAALRATPPTRDAISRLAAVMDGYLSADRSTRTMGPDVRSLLAWVRRGLAAEIEADVSVDEVTIPYDAHVWNGSQPTLVRVTGMERGQSVETSFTANNSEIGGEAHPVGQTGPIAVGTLNVGFGPRSYTVTVRSPRETDPNLTQSVTVTLDASSGTAAVPVSLHSGSNEPAVKLTLRIVCPELNIGAKWLPAYHE